MFYKTTIQLEILKSTFIKIIAFLTFLCILFCFVCVIITGICRTEKYLHACYETFIYNNVKNFKPFEWTY